MYALQSAFLPPVPHQVYQNIASILKHTSESEDTWSLLNDTIKELDALYQENPHSQDLLSVIQWLANDIKVLLSSEEILLVTSALGFVEALGSNLNPEDFSPFERQFVPSILELIERDSQGFQLRAGECITTLVKKKQIQDCVPVLVERFTGGNDFAKYCLMGIMMEYIQCFATDMEPHLGSVEDILRAGYSDTSEDVREISRCAFDIFQEKFEDRARNLFNQETTDTKSPSLPGLCGETEYNSESTSEMSSTPTSCVQPKFVQPLELSKNRTKYLAKNPPSSTTHVPKLTVPYSELPYMKLTQAYRHRISKTAAASEPGLKPWETSGANIENFTSSLRMYPVMLELSERKPFRV
ncbi:hypothetical protein K493DRAFT_296527 [Basidiobolus meristosporus CBS 931.73]|uniref:CLASP N-terminal domain-containing protein n=1 Tax=Basidiobolus meristosporus CBS 931.73 TaxID=1314790 RepID=A0A1Y1Z4X6_9FUNG|nr:hypothetical protein K493DRAFT_296527 [Basidiobolus meristosporus CBS 931.73]|eukprot:ORY05321.1 hypothetical protein K493DRAFT_296527 [Basidiobolus meristosporus CBS 931.73]